MRSKVIDKTELIGSSSVITKLKSEIEKVAPTSGRVMIHGGGGSGKELAARLIHKKSRKASGPFIVFSPTALTVTKIQQELFGDEEKQEQGTVFDKRISVLEAAKQRIEWTFDTFERVYLSFSAGKDSTVMLHLVADEARKRGVKFGLLIVDIFH